MRIADMHCDTISKIWESRRGEKPQELAANSLHVDIQRMKRAGYLLQNFAMFINLKNVIDPFEHVLDMIGVFYEEIEKNKNDISVIKTYDEIIQNERLGKMSALLTIEEGECCKGRIENLEKLYALGARMMTLTWNYPNGLGSPNIFNDKTDADGFALFDGTKGLAKKGFEFVERMEELGIIIDVSHLSDAGFWQIADCAKKPFAASHSNARLLCAHARNLTDDMIKAIAERGGVVGLNYYGSFLNQKNVNISTAAGIAKHARHIADIGGIECLGLGSDFDGISGDMEIADCSQVPKLFDALEKEGFSQSGIEKIAYKNVMRVYKHML